MTEPFVGVMSQAAERVRERAGAQRPMVLHLVRPGGAPAAPAFSLKKAVPAGDAGAVLCAAAVRGTSDQFAHNVVLVGGNGAAERARVLGLEAMARIAPPFGRAELCGPALRRIVDDTGPPAIIQGWGMEFVPLMGQVAAGGAVWSFADLDAGVMQVNPLRGLPKGFELVPWMGAAGAREAGSRRGLRIALVGDPPGALDAVAFVYLCGILHVGGIRATAVLPRGAYGLERALHHVRTGGYVQGVEVVDGPIVDAALRCDFGVCITADEQPISFAGRVLLSALGAAGVQVIMRDEPWTRAFVPEAAQCLLTPSLKPATVARAVPRLLEDGRLEACSRALGAAAASRQGSAVASIAKAWDACVGAPR